MPDSSPEPSFEAADSAVDITDVSTTASSSSAESQGPSTVFDAVKSALDLGAKENSPDSARDQADPANPLKSEPVAQVAAGADEELGEVTEAEVKSYGPKTQKRIRQLLEQRQEASEKAEAFEGKASQFDQIERFREQNRLSNDDLAIGLDLVALIKNDPEKAFERLTPIYRKVAERVGQILPPEMQARVDSGHISAEDARELVKSKSTLSLVEQRRAEETERAQNETIENNAKALVASVTSTSEEWESAKKASDPDWNLKQDRIGEILKLEVYEKGFPTTKKATVELLDGIHKRVTDEYARFAPRRQGITPLSGTASTNAVAEPTSALEAVKRALGGA